MSLLVENKRSNCEDAVDLVESVFSVSQSLFPQTAATTRFYSDGWRKAILCTFEQIWRFMQTKKARKPKQCLKWNVNCGKKNIASCLVPRTSNGNKEKNHGQLLVVEKSRRVSCIGRWSERGPSSRRTDYCSRRFLSELTISIHVWMLQCFNKMSWLILIPQKMLFVR